MIFLRVYSYSWAMSLITPGQAGDATIILLMKKYSIPISLTSSAYFVDKIITLSLFVAISAYGCSYLIPIQEITYQSTVKYLLIALSVFVAVFFLMSIKLKIFNKLRRFLGGVRQNLVILKNDHRILLANIVLTIVKWIVVSWSFHYAFLSFGITIEWPDIGVIPIMSTLVGYIPISIGGIGTVELSATYWFGLKDVPATIVVTSYIFMRLINYFLALGVIVVMNPFKAE